MIGELDGNGDFQITADTTTVLDNWNYNLLEHGNIDAQLTKLLTYKTDTIVYLQATGVSWSSTVALKVNGQV